MPSVNILERPPQFQWDSDSTCQSSNCRTTSEAMIAGFYKDTHISPNSMRQAMGYSSCGGTDAPHGVIGLQKNGIPASWGQLTTAQVIVMVQKNIPVDIAVVYGSIPRDTKYIQDMNFYGLHSVVACKRAVSGGTIKGLIIRDPDRWSAGQTDHQFWPDSVWMPAFAAAKYVAVWPNNAKIGTVTAPPIPVVYPYSSYKYTKNYHVNTYDGLYQRSAPNTTSIKEALRPQDYIVQTFLRTDKGSSYTGPNGVASTSWVATRTNDGKYHWFALSYLKLI